MTGITTARRRSTASNDDAERTHNEHPIADLPSLTGKITKKHAAVPFLLNPLSPSFFSTFPPSLGKLSYW
jgi:hypothetical protein